MKAPKRRLEDLVVGVFADADFLGWDFDWKVQAIQYHVKDPSCLPYERRATLQLLYGLGDGYHYLPRTAARVLKKPLGHVLNLERLAMFDLRRAILKDAA